MKLALIDGTPAPETPDWEWNGGFEARSSLRDMEGNWIELIDLPVRAASRGRNVSDDTYVFQTAELCGISALLYERIFTDIPRLPTVSLSDSFPYRLFPYRSELGMFQITVLLHHTDHPSGQACFVCERDSADGREDSSPSCPLCPNVNVKALTGPNLVTYGRSHFT